VTALVHAEGLSKSFVVSRSLVGRPRRRVHAVRDVDVDLAVGRTLAIVGESGSGKSTLARLLLRLVLPDAGRVEFNGTDLSTLGQRALRELRRNMQMVFQDPYGALDPRMVVGDHIAEPLRVHRLVQGKAARRRRAIELLDRVGLSERHLDRFPDEFSGGQLQRVVIARALATSPQLLVCDEPVAALDMSIRAQVMNLLADLQREHKMSYLFVTHDLSLLPVIADDISVMYKGAVVERGSAAAVLSSPSHPYTQMLLASIPSVDPRRRSITTRTHGQVGDLVRDPEAGCPFAPRCGFAMQICRETPPPWRVTAAGVGVACHLVSGAGERSEHSDLR
jgi:oligopeptide transport system ATP-binding protein